MAGLDQASKELMELAFLAIDHAIDSVRTGGPLIPFTVTVVNGERSIARFVGNTLEDSLAKARHSVREGSESLSAYAVAYDGFLTVDGQRTDAIFVEAGERGSDEALILAQRYRPKKVLKEFEVIGNVAHVGTERNRLK